MDSNCQYGVSLLFNWKQTSICCIGKSCVLEIRWTLIFAYVAYVDQGFVFFAAILLKFAYKFVLLVILVVEDETIEPFLATFSRVILQKAFLKTISGYLHSFSKYLTILSRGQD